MARYITQLRRGTKEQWQDYERTHPIESKPLDGELVVEFDNGVPRLKIGDGRTPYSELPYMSVDSFILPTPATINLLGGAEYWKEEYDDSNNLIGYTQVVEVKNYTITPNSKVDIQLSPAMLSAFNSKDVSFTAVTDTVDGITTVTVHAVGEMPQNTYENIQVTITEVTAEVQVPNVPEEPDIPTEPDTPDEPDVPVVPDEPEEETASVSGTWYFHEKISDDLEGAVVSFISDGILYDYIHVDLDSEVLMYGDEEVAYDFYNDNWIEEAYRTITFDGVQTVSKEFYDCFVANAVQQTFTFTIAGTTYYADVGMTWEQWVASSYNTGGYIIYTDPYNGIKRLSPKSNTSLSVNCGELGQPIVADNYDLGK